MNTLEIISRTNVTSEGFGDSERPAWRYNWTTGDVFPAPKPSPDFQNLLGVEIQRYVHWWEENFAPSFLSVGYKVGFAPSRDESIFT